MYYITQSIMKYHYGTFTIHIRNSFNHVELF